MRIAVIGSGISGNAAAFALSATHDVTLYEREARTGGHSATVDIDYDGVSIAVDTGFIVYNELNYPHLSALFRYFNIETKASNMSFSVSLDHGRVEWAGNDLGTLFAQWRNLMRPRFLWMLREILRFNRTCVADLETGQLDGLSLGAYLIRGRYSQGFIDDYLIPMGAAIWSTPDMDMLSFPAESFVRFFSNHRLIDFDRPVWRTVSGGSRKYVEPLLSRLREAQRIRLHDPVVAVTRFPERVHVVTASGHVDHYDQVVFAAHSDETLAMLTDPSPEEQAILSAIRYRSNEVILHRDETLMPHRRKVWSAWNYVRTREKDRDSPPTVSYWMNLLQGIDPRKPLFITLNPVKRPDERLIFGTYRFDHPQFDRAALDAQKHLPLVQGQKRSWFCGAWTGYGFHEDGLVSGLNIARRLGGVIPWERQALPFLVEAAE